MPANRQISQVLDQHRFDALSASLVSGRSDVAVLLLDRDLRIRGVNATYEELSMRQGGELLGKVVFDAFPDDPNDPQASGSSQLAESVESALRRRGMDTMPIVRYDIADPQNPDVFLPKLWTCSNTVVDDGDEPIGVLHQVAEISSLDAALAALSRSITGSETLSATAQVHVLGALAAQARADRERTEAMAKQLEQLHRAIDTRDIIGQAKGMVMERFDVDAASAFSLLVQLSQQSNTPLAEIARKLVEIDHPDNS